MVLSTIPPAHTRLRLTTLGKATLSADYAEVPLPAKAVVLLTLLALKPQKRCSRDIAVSLLWPTAAEDRGRHSLNQMLHVIRNSVRSTLVAAEADDLVLINSIDLDITEFRTALTQNQISKALTLYRGAFLEHVAVEGSAFEDWRSAQQQALVEDLERQVSTKTDLLFLKGDVDRCVNLIDKVSSQLGDYWDETIIQPVIRRAIRGRSSTSATHSPPIVGRDREVTLLAQAHKVLQRGVGSVIMLVAEAGYGKTLLMNSFVTAVRQQGSSAVIIRGYQPERAFGFTALRDLMTDERVRPHLESLPESQQTFLRAAIGEGTNTIALDVEKRHFVLDASARLLELAGRDTPLIVSVDDLHWVDQSSVELVAFLARRAARIPILLIVSKRPEHFESIDDLETGAHGPVLRLRPLSIEDVQEYAGDFVSQNNCTKVSHAIIKRTGGHPYLVGEVLRPVIASQQWSISAIRQASTSSLQEFLARQTAGLSKKALMMLQLLATLAKPTPYTLIRKALGFGVVEFLRSLQQLLERDLVTDKMRTLNCAHDLIRESVYSSMTSVQRAILHKRCASVLTTNGADVLYHLKSARDRKRTYVYALREVRRTSTIAAARESDDCYRVAIAAATGGRKKALLTYLRAHNALALGQLETAKRVFTQLAKQSHPMLNKKRIEIEFCLLDIERELGASDRAGLSQGASHVISAAAEAGDVETQVDALILKGRLHLLDGYADEHEVSAVIQALVALASGHPTAEAGAFGLTWAVGALAFMGRPEEAEELVEEIRRRYSEIGSTRFAGNLAACQAILHSHNGHIAEAIACSRSAISHAEADGLWRLRKNILANFSGVLIEAAEDKTAKEVLLELVRTSDVDQALPFRALAHTNFALLSLYQGDLQVARVQALRGLEIAERLQKPWPIAYASAILGLVALEQGSIADARAHRDRVLRMAGTYFGNDELPMAKLVTQLAELEDERSVATAWLESLIADARVSAVCRASLEVELARLLGRENRQKGLEILERVSAFARVNGAVRLFEAAESVQMRLKLIKGRN